MKAFLRVLATWILVLQFLVVIVLFALFVNYMVGRQG